ncbi:MAG: type II toxin-antitoxin system VapC family toxin [Deltaproteobacteria bacterium]|nr:type II toxin-antitoxin system VapC family toxin [Deltaproteobacteria bacterium]
MTANKTLLDASFVGGILGTMKPVQTEIFQSAVDLALKGKLIAPILITYEIGNVIVTHCRYNKISPEPYWSIFNTLKIDLLAPEDLVQIYAIAQQYGLSFYDASYVAILKQEKADLLLTFDGDFKKVKDHRINFFE